MKKISNTLFIIWLVFTAFYLGMYYNNQSEIHGWIIGVSFWTIMVSYWFRLLAKDSETEK